MAAAENVVRQQVTYQERPQFSGFHRREKRWAIIVAHRRCGKTVACIIELITRALATAKSDARYAYIAPYREQAKLVAWDYLKRYAESVIKSKSESELSVELLNGSRIRLFGADNPDALRGMYLDGVVLDEFADMRPSLWGEIIRPLLTDRKGWAVFIGTPKGKNVFYDIYERAANDADWMRLTLRASETGILPPEELADARKGMTENQYEQEFECSFDAAIFGAIYAKEIASVRKNGRIRAVPCEPTKLVSTYWDLGRGDATSIWFFQNINGEKRFIDFYEASGEVITHYLSVLRSKGYNYDTLWLPHDAEHKLLSSEQTIAEICRKNGFRVAITPNLPLSEGINAARLLLSVCYFDAERCAPGLEALTAYQWDYNQRLDELKPTPLHNWASHAADAFRYAGVAQRVEKGRPKAITVDSRGIV
jgi:phage terminase large subunit